MANLNSNMLLVILAGVVLIAIIYYLNKNDDQPVPNHGTLPNNTNNFAPITQKAQRPLQPQQINTRSYDDISDSIVDELVSQYNIDDIPVNASAGNFSASDPMANDYGQFNGYIKKRQINMKNMELPYSDTEYDNRDFSYKKKKFTRRTPEDVKDLFDVNKMLPQEIEEDWFDVEPLQSTKKIKGTHLIHPKVHMGVNTVGSSLRNGTHDIRGDIPNPKINISPFLNSTIEPDTNIKGFCNPI
ncbi:hypothetical protein QJ856_gp0529 [Tupanvirus deep ocean]|uniref:Uncharacterized protein n=2 Tax=Tupanvirus TaxID=2094720 RepID=A0AC62A8Y0_9VIRU|nr:hypothetical protein QJ856_gp0529 [Tupanvirus deep ocean]QKU34217.1 hypothetical protein [Tupanvirus deep ocean]